MSESTDDLEREVRRQASITVDPEQFVLYSRRYAAAAQALDGAQQSDGGLDLRHTDARCALHDEAAVVAAMRTLSPQMRKDGLSDDLRYAILMRWMYLPGLLDAQELKPFMTAAPDGGTIVSTALLKACASAGFVFGSDAIRFDTADVARKAGEFREQEPK
jgi:hypothetical protein